MIPLLFLDGLLETASELNFVIRVMVFAYLLFWCYITFQEYQLLFGISGLVTGYFVFLHGISITLLVIFMVFFIFYGMQIQQLVQFGVMPLLGYHHQGTSIVKASTEEEQLRQQQAVQIIQQKMERGIATQQEINWLSQVNGVPIQQSPDYNQMLRRRV